MFPIKLCKRSLPRYSESSEQRHCAEKRIGIKRGVLSCFFKNSQDTGFPNCSLRFYHTRRQKASGERAGILLLIFSLELPMTWTMKRNMDLVRDILLSIEENGSYKHLQEKYPGERVNDHVTLMMGGNLIVADYHI